MSDAPQPPTASPPGPPPRRPRRRVGLLAALLIGGAAAGAWWYARRDRPPEPPALHAQDGADPAVVAAVEAARQQVLAEPKSADRWGELGLVFGAHGYEDEADRCFAEAERRNPAEPRWPYLRGVFAATHRPDRAEAHFRRALDLGPRDPMARAAGRLRLAELLLTRERADEAEALFTAQLRDSPADPRARFGLAQVALARGDRAAARAALEPLADGPFTRKRATALLAALARTDGDLTGAARYEDAARRARDDLPWPDPYVRDLLVRGTGRQARLREAERLEAAGDLPRATQMLVEMARAEPNARVLAAAAMNLTKMHEYAQAEELLRDCLRREPGHSQASYFLAVVLFERAEHERAERPEEARQMFRDAAAHARRAVETKPDHGLAWLYLGRSLLAAGDPAAALDPLRQAVACRPEFVDPHLYLAEALAAAKQTGEAIRHARNAEELAKPGDARPRQLLDRLTGKSRPAKQ